MWLLNNCPAPELHKHWSKSRSLWPPLACFFPPLGYLQSERGGQCVCVCVQYRWRKNGKSEIVSNRGGLIAKRSVVRFYIVVQNAWDRLPASLSVCLSDCWAVCCHIQSRLYFWWQWVIALRNRQSEETWHLLSLIDIFLDALS